MLMGCVVYSQKTFRNNTAYFELGGNGLYTSINYERVLANKPKIGIHIGLGRYRDGKYYLTIPFGMNYFLRIHNSNFFLDFGFGATYSKADILLYINVKREPNYVNTNYWNYISSFGFRQYIKNRIMYRFALTPVINQYGLIPYVGISVGGQF